MKQINRQSMEQVTGAGPVGDLLGTVGNIVDGLLGSVLGLVNGLISGLVPKK